MTAKTDAKNTLDLLLKMEIPKPPEKEVKILRLSKACGQDVVFKLKALPYDRVAEIEDMHHADDTPVFIVLAGCISPDLKNQGLLKKYGAFTPEDLVKKMLLPGEIEDLSRAIETLSGYRVITYDEVKKK